MKPFTFKAFGQTWKVKISKSHAEIKNNFGYLDEDNNIIYITPDATDEQQRSTLLHEIIHLVGMANGLNLSEHTVLCLESGLFGAYNGNKMTI